MKQCDFCGKIKTTRRKKIKCLFTPVSSEEAERGARWRWKTIDGVKRQCCHYNYPKKDMYFVFNICNDDLRFCYKWVYYEVKDYKKVISVRNDIKNNCSYIETDD